MFLGLAALQSGCSAGYIAAHTSKSLHANAFGGAQAMTNSPMETADNTAASNAAGVEEDSLEPKGDGEGDV